MVCFHLLVINFRKNQEQIMKRLGPRPSKKKHAPVKPVSAVSDKGYMKPSLFSSIPVIQRPTQGKARPPPKTEECFYWRTMGCTYEENCFNLHIPAHKGIDNKPSKKYRFRKSNVWWKLLKWNTFVIGALSLMLSFKTNSLLIEISSL